MSRLEPHPGSAWVVDALRAVFAADAAAAAGGHGVVAAGPTPAAQPAAGVTWAQVLQAVQRHRVVGVVAPHAQALGCPPEVVERAHRLHLVHVGSGMVLSMHTARVSATLAAAGIDHLVVKGVGLAAVMGLRAVDRGGGDIDVWVRPADAARADEVLRADGWARGQASTPLPTEARRWRWLLREEQEVMLVRPDAPSVDLHWRLSEFAKACSFGFDEAFAASVEVPEVGPTVRTLAAPHALEHVSVHARKEAWVALRQVAEVVRLAWVCGPEQVSALAARSRDVRLAVGLAARLDARVVGWVGPLGAADRRLVDEAWARCLAFGSYAVRRRETAGWARVAARAGYSSWMMRSAPGWGARWRHVTRLLGRSRVLVDRSFYLWRSRA